MTMTEVSSTIRINPTTWDLGLHDDRAQLRPAPIRILTVAGQGSIDATAGR